MKKLLKWLSFSFVLASFSTFVMPSIALAQDDGDYSPPPGRKTRSKDAKRTGRAAEEPNAESGKEQSSLFPDWGTRDFSWALHPMVAAKTTDEDRSDIGRIHTTTLEGGLAVGLYGIPLVPGNPGLYVEPSAGYVWGAGTTSYKVDGKSTRDAFSYDRSYANLDTILFWKFYRHTLGIGRGMIVYGNEELHPKIQDLKVRNDFGFLVYSWMSLHYTHQYLRVYSREFSEPLFNEQDNWLHARFALAPLNFSFDLGPGITLAEEFAKDPITGDNNSLAKGQEDYFLMLTSFNPFWKIGFSGRAKYVFASSEEELGQTYGGTKLPEQGLYEPASVVMPEDSMVLSTFVGIRDLFMGMGIGWYYNLQVLNLAEKNDSKRETTRDSGFGLSFATSF